MGLDLKKDYKYSLLVPTSMGIRITPVNGQPVHSSDTYILQATSAETNVASVSSHQWMIFLIIAFTTGGAAIFLYYYGLKKITASVATICELAFPLTAVVLEYFIHRNILGPVQWIGVAVLIFSIVKVSRININNVKS